MGRGRRRANQTSGALTKVKHYARITETDELPATMVVNSDSNYQFSILSFPRALALSRNFKFYRAKRVVWTYLPDYNTFQSGAGSTSMPSMAFIMNRTGDDTSWTIAEYDAQGATPKLFAKKRVIAYAPNIVQSVQYLANPGGLPPYVGNVGTRPVFNQWLATGTFNQDVLSPAGPVIVPNASTYLKYYGHSIYWTATNAVSGQELGTAFCEVEWEFKDPLFAQTQATPAPEAPVGAEA